MKFAACILVSLSLIHSLKTQEVDGETPSDMPEITTNQIDPLRAFNEKIQSCTDESGISIDQRSKIFGNDYSDDSKETKVR